MDLPSDPEVAPESLPPENVAEDTDGDLLFLPTEEYGDAEEEFEEEPDTELRLHVPRVLIWVGLAVSSLMCTLMVLVGYGQGSWNYGDDTRIDLSGCLPALSHALAETDAPAAAQYRLKAAAHPGIWNYEAYTLLREAQHLLEPHADEIKIATVLNRLKSMLPDDFNFRIGCSEQHAQSELILPTLHPVP